MRRNNELQPISGRFLGRIRRQDFYDVAGIQYRIQRHHFIVYSGAYALVADLGMDFICKVDHGCSGGQIEHFALGRKYVNFVGYDI